MVCSIRVILMKNDINFLLQQATNCLQQGRFEDAGTFAQQVITISPLNGDANLMLGVVACQRGNHDIAEQYFTSAIRSNPYHPIYHFNHAIALGSAQRLGKAVVAYERTIQLKPDFAEAYNNLGTVLQKLGRIDEAFVAFNHAIQYRPNYGGAYYNRGAAFADIACFNDALSDYRMATRLMPEFADAFNNCGDMLQKLNRYDEAEYYVRRALALNPVFAIAYANLGAILNKTGRLQEAEYCLREAVRISPELAVAHSNLLFLLASASTLSADTLFEEQRNWDHIHGCEGRLNALPSLQKEPVTDRRLRIGYLSPDFRTHAVSYFFEPLLVAHDKSRYEIFCYASHNKRESDATTDRLRGIAEHWRFVADHSDQQLAQLIREDRIDLLVDLAGHTANNRLMVFSYSPAPVQATYLGYIASTGLESMNYWITDEVLHPFDTEEKCIESIFRLPRCWVAYKPYGSAPDIAPCPNLDDNVVFGSLNCSSKMTEATVETWCNILKELPGSRLLLMDGSLSSEKIQKCVIEKFANFQITSQRLLLRSNAPMYEYLATYNEVDIVLDTFPRTGGTTTAEALWMGVPVITLAGKRYAERISTSKLKALELDQLIAKNRNEYVKKAVSLARDPAYRSEIRQQLRPRMARSPLCDGDSLARAIESAYRSMWDNYCSV